jgi:hypothetical protein
MAEEIALPLSSRGVATHIGQANLKSCTLGRFLPKLSAGARALDDLRRKAVFLFVLSVAKGS